MKIVVMEGRLFLQDVQSGDVEFDLTEHIESTIRMVLRQEMGTRVPDDRKQAYTMPPRHRYSWLLKIYYKGGEVTEEVVQGLDNVLGLTKDALEQQHVNSVQIFRGGAVVTRSAA